MTLKKVGGDSRIDSGESKTTETRSMNSAASSPASPEFKSLFKQAMDFRGEGRLDDAVDLLRRLLGMNPNSASARALLGDTLWDLGRLDEAVDAFQHAVTLAPGSEMASLGLFHTLWES